MSAELDEQYVAMDQNKVPANWANVAYPSLKPLASWITDLIQRINFMRTWLLNGQPNTFWMGGFYFPQGFMTGASQNHARKYKIAIDSLRWAFEVKRMKTADDVQDGALLLCFCFVVCCLSFYFNVVADIAFLFVSFFPPLFNSTGRWLVHYRNVLGWCCV